MPGISRLFILLIPLFLLLLLSACGAGPKLPPLPADGVVLAFGDSLTFGTGAGPAESYPAVLEQLIGRKVVNRGIPGEISADGLARLPGELDSVHPALLILCHCANDMLRHMDRAQAADNLRAMVRLARERGIPVVLIAVPAPDLSLTPPEFYRQVAAEAGVPLEARILPRILAKGALKSDHIHPNAAGYRQMAEALAALLGKAGALR